MVFGMEWGESDSLKFIEEVRDRRCLRDPTDPGKKNKNKRNDAWKEIGEIFPSHVKETKELQNKWLNLCQSYRAYKRQVEKSKKSGAGRNEIYTPTWFAYALMDSFMKDVYKPHGASDVVSKYRVALLICIFSFF